MKIDELLQEISKNTEKTSNAKAVFGDPITTGNVTIIPVAKVQLRGGGGGGEGNSAVAKGLNGFGLGLATGSTPIGYIEVKDGEAKFVRITDTASLVKQVIIGSVILVLLMKAFRK